MSQRLTERTPGGRAVIRKDIPKVSRARLLEVCAEYEDAEEEGCIKHCPICGSFRFKRFPDTAIKALSCVDCGTIKFLEESEVVVANY